MKKIIIPIICLCLLLTGCGIHWSYATTIKAIDNEYFKTKVIYEDSECMIIENEITGEYFLVVSGGYGVTITPIAGDYKSPAEQEGYLMSDDAIDDMESKSPSMSDGAGVNANAFTP